MKIALIMPYKNIALRLVIVVVIVFLLVFASGAKAGMSAALPLFQSTPDPCGPAVALPRNPQINVRRGPSTSYSIIIEVGPDALPILGRHHAFSWWQVSLPDGTSGWVSNDVVSVSGYVEGVPLVAAPELNGYVPDLNEEWVPFVAIPCGAPPPATAVMLPTQNPSAMAIGVLENGNDVWSSPLNLSQSGVARSPVAVVEPAGISHLIWQEESANNFLYIRGQESDWSTPIPVELPFGTRRYYPELRSEEPTPPLCSSTSG